MNQANLSRAAAKKPTKIPITNSNSNSNTKKKTTPRATTKKKTAAKRGVRTDNLNLYNNVPLAKLYPEAAKKRAEKKALDKKVAANFMKGMVTKRIVTPTRATIRAVMPMPKPQKKAMPLTKDVARKRIMAMKGLNGRNKFSLVNRLSLNQHSPRKVVRLARELARLR